MKPTLFTIEKIAGMYYPCGKSTKTILIYGLGGPTVPDNGNLPDAKFVLEKGIDLFVPDYVGFGRSKGKFTPENCIQTFVTLFDNFKQGCVGVNYYSSLEKKFRYKTILFAGKSLAGAYLPLLPKYREGVSTIAIFCPAVDQKAQGEIAGEESNADFLRSMKYDGYKYLYRGIENPIWEKHLENEDGLSPMDNIPALKKAKLFIGHGKKDTCIHYSKSVKYYKKILKAFPNKEGDIVIKLYPQGDHSQLTTNKAMTDFLKWIKV